MPLPHGNDQNRGGYLLSVIWSQFAISFCLVALRFYCRIRVTRNVWWDDWCCLFAFICIIAFSCILSVYAHNGGAAHRWELQPAQVSHLVELNFVSQVFQVMSVAVGKISVALLIYRLQPPTKWRTWLLCFLSVSSLIIAFLVIIIFLVQCQPTSALWRPGIGTCWDQTATNDWIVAAGSYWALVDLLLALLPITFLYKLQISWKRKMVLGMLLGLGVFAAICAAIKVAHIRTKTTDYDITWDTTSLLVWNTTEANVIIYAACLPTVSEFLKRFLGNTALYIAPYLRFTKISSHGERQAINNGDQHVELGSLTDEGMREYQAKARHWSDEDIILQPVEAH